MSRAKFAIEIFDIKSNRVQGKVIRIMETKSP
jgi:hypothetical protein